MEPSAPLSLVVRHAAWNRSEDGADGLLDAHRQTIAELLSDYVKSISLIGRKQDRHRRRG